MKKEAVLFGVCFLCENHFPVEKDPTAEIKDDKHQFVMSAHSSNDQVFCDGSGVKPRWTFPDSKPLN